MNQFCTLFDKNYLYFGLALHLSLMERTGAFRLFMLAMDKTCEQALRTLNLENVVVVSLDEVITPDLAFVHETMNFGQICWTCQPLLCRYVLDHHGADAVTYLEADSYFFADPQVLFDEVGDRSVSLVAHNYAPAHDQSKTSGTYCVQFNLFKNDRPSRQLLNDWQQACLTYDRKRSGHYPGQLCMNDWPSRSPAVCIVKNIGAGVAPWNVSRFQIGTRQGQPTVDDLPIVFYHFHELAFADDGAFFLSSYALPPQAIEFVYRPYLMALDEVRRLVRNKVIGFDHCKSFRSPGLWRSLASLNSRQVRNYARYLYLALKGRKNFVQLAA